MPLQEKGTLCECKTPSNCVLIEWEVKNDNLAFSKLIEIATKLPRTTILEKTNIYWHGLCRSFIFRFPDDLEILNVPRKKGIIQVRSASRIGQSDLGVNRNRVNSLFNDLMKVI
tara:strand:+ start:543 stop:884 length:342 start_codon:yes stop_codon:yes gene_type:complete